MADVSVLEMAGTVSVSEAESTSATSKVVCKVENVVAKSPNVVKPEQHLKAEPVAQVPVKREPAAESSPQTATASVPDPKTAVKSEIQMASESKVVPVKKEVCETLHSGDTQKLGEVSVVPKPCKAEPGVTLSSGGKSELLKPELPKTGPEAERGNTGKPELPNLRPPKIESGSELGSNTKPGLSNPGIKTEADAKRGSTGHTGLSKPEPGVNLVAPRDAEPANLAPGAKPLETHCDSKDIPGASLQNPLAGDSEEDVPLSQLSVVATQAAPVGMKTSARSVAKACATPPVASASTSSQTPLPASIPSRLSTSVTLLPPTTHATFDARSELAVPSAHASSTGRKRKENVPDAGDSNTLDVPSSRSPGVKFAKVGAARATKVAQESAAVSREVDVTSFRRGVMSGTPRARVSSVPVPSAPDQLQCVCGRHVQSGPHCKTRFCQLCAEKLRRDRGMRFRAGDFAWKIARKGRQISWWPAVVFRLEFASESELRPYLLRFFHGAPDFWASEAEVQEWSLPHGGRGAEFERALRLASLAGAPAARAESEPSSGVPGRLARSTTPRKRNERGKLGRAGEAAVMVKLNAMRKMLAEITKKNEVLRAKLAVARGAVSERARVTEQGP